MAIKNYVSRTRQWEINTLLDQILLDADKSYPEDSVIDIIKAHIPDVAIVELDFNKSEQAVGSRIRGAIFKKSADFKQTIIAIKNKQSKRAKNFTLAHEFGHYCLGHMGDANFMIDHEEFDGSEHMQTEAEAQYFAASLLMPLEKFSKLSHILTIPQLAQRFGVSEAAVGVRKAWLDGKDRDGII